jgi:hypothetical protein
MKFWFLIAGSSDRLPAIPDLRILAQAMRMQKEFRKEL